MFCVATGPTIDESAATLFDAMTQTRPASGRFTHISSASDAALEIGLYYYNHYPLTPYTTPVVSDPFADYGRAGAYTTPVVSDPFAGYGRAGAYTTLLDPQTDYANVYRVVGIITE